MSATSQQGEQHVGSESLIVSKSVERYRFKSAWGECEMGSYWSKHVSMTNVTIVPLCNLKVTLLYL